MKTRYHRNAKLVVIGDQAATYKRGAKGVAGSTTGRAKFSFVTVIADDDSEVTYQFVGPPVEVPR